MYGRKKGGKVAKGNKKVAGKPGKRKQPEPEPEPESRSESSEVSSSAPDGVAVGGGVSPAVWNQQQSAFEFLVRRIPKSAAVERANPAPDWLQAAWNAVSSSRVRFQEEPDGEPYTWADQKRDNKPRNLRTTIWSGMVEGGVDLSLDKIAEAAKAPAGLFTVEELIAICARISNVGIASTLRPMTMLSLACHVFRDHASIKAAQGSNAISDMNSLNDQLSLVYSDPDLIDRYLRDVVHPKHRNCEEFHTFMKRCLTAYVSVSWYVKLDEVITGIVDALPLNLWTESSTVLVNALTELKDKPDLLRLGTLCLEHESQFRGLIKVRWDSMDKKHRWVKPKPVLELSIRPEKESRRDLKRHHRDRDSDRKSNRDRSRDTKDRSDRKSKEYSKRKLSHGKRERKEPARDANATAPDDSDVTCYACGKPGHVVPRCPDVAAKVAYEKKREAEKGSVKDASKGNSSKKLHTKGQK